MQSKEFVPPRYEKKIHVLFEKNTGEVLAMEERWTFINGQSSQSINLELLKSLASQSGRRVEDIEVMNVTEELKPLRVIARIDVTQRIPILAEAPASLPGASNPSRLVSP